AFTAQTAAGDSSTIHRAVASAPAGSVLVVGAEGAESRAVWGYVLTVAAVSRGVGGAVIDGSVRDLEAIRAEGFPLFAPSTCPAGPHKGHPGTVGEPISCGGVVVAPGDVVVADTDGVTVVPAALQGEVPRLARERRAVERTWLERIRDGESSLAVLNLE
ncbi:MAG: RraA family protein, partial [Acidimicrobiia bacterium]